MSRRVVVAAVAGVALVVLVAAGAGFGGYQLGLRDGRLATKTASSSPSPLATIAPTSRPLATPSPSPGVFPAVTAVHNAVVDALSCKLPVYLPGQHTSGGFISFPDGAVTPDRSSDVGAPGSSMGGGDAGDWFGLTYVKAVNRWVPVPYTWVQPDGAIYAYAMDHNRHAGANPLVLVNARTSTDALLANRDPSGGGWQVISVTSTSIYAVSISGQGISIVPLSGPSAPDYISDGYWTAASGFYAYGTALPDGGAIVRLDGRNNQRTPWFNKSSTADVIGFDGAGSPVIWTGTDLWIASAPDVATRIGSVAPLPWPRSSEQPVRGALAPVSDSHGMWFSTTDGIYLFAGGKTTKVSNLVAEVAGVCS